MMKTIFYIKLFLIVLLISCSTVIHYDTNETKFIKTPECSDCDEFLQNKFKISNKNVYENNASFCFDYFIRQGDYSAIVLPTSDIDSIRENVLKPYLKGFEIDSTSTELSLKIAYVYQNMDSVGKALYYYSKINDSKIIIPNRYRFYKGIDFVKESIKFMLIHVPEQDSEEERFKEAYDMFYGNKYYRPMDIDKITNNLLYKDSLTEVFLKGGKESFLLLDYLVDYRNFIYEFIDECIKKPYYTEEYIKIYGTGDFEACIAVDSTKEMYQQISGKLSTDKLVKILSIFEKTNFLNFTVYWEYDEIDINRFDFDYDYMLYAYVPRIFHRITIETPKFSHSFRSYGLSENKGIDSIGIDDPCRLDCKMINYSLLWRELFSEELLKYAEEED